jgi:hypothetical protein
MGSLQNFLLFAGCSMFSLYLFPVGGVQAAHILLAMAACVALLNDRICFTPPAVMLLLLAGIAFAREAFAILSGAPTSVLVQPLYILFNLAVFVGVYTIYFHSRSVESYRWGCTVAIAIALGSLLITGVELTGAKIEERAIGSFQAPNQLAYFAAIMFSTTVLLYTFERISALTTIFLVAAILLLALAAQSKAGLIGLLLGLAALLVGRPSSRIWGITAISALVLAWVLKVFDFERLLFLKRLKDIGSDSDDSFVARGYLLLVDNAQTALDVWFGLGTSGVKSLQGYEIHSTYASFFGLYGMVGGILYLAFLASWLWALYRVVSFSRFIAIAGPPLLYGIAHNGTRFSIFYAMIALSLALCEERRMSFRRARPELMPGWMLSSDLARSGPAGVAGQDIPKGRPR